MQKKRVILHFSIYLFKHIVFHWAIPKAVSNPNMYREAAGGVIIRGAQVSLSW